MPRAYYASKISENISQSPEGYLICLNVPIARTGVQDYLARELDLEDYPPDTVVKVYRDEKEVFSSAALASFEGKPLTDDHPAGEVSPNNVNRLIKGVCTNIRRGKGNDADKVIADIIVYDQPLINEIMNGKRAISCGYDCAYEFDEEGGIQQKNIRGNHVAVVTAGRAGNEVAIHDKAPETPESTPLIAAPKIKRRKSYMGKTNEKSKNSAGLLGRLFPMVAKDADPDAVAEVMEELAEALSPDPAPIDNAPAPSPAPAAPAKEPAADSEEEEKVPKWAQDLATRMADIEAALKNPADNDPLEQLEKELAGGEESVTIEAEKLGDNESMDEEETTDEDGPIAEGSGTDPKGTSDSRAAILSALRAIKPAIAGIKDIEQRKAVSDSMAKLLRSNLGMKGAGKGAGYSAIVDAKNKAAVALKAKDADAASKAQRAESLGRDLAAKYNPHYREKK